MGVHRCGRVGRACWGAQGGRRTGAGRHAGAGKRAGAGGRAGWRGARGRRTVSRRACVGEQQLSAGTGRRQGAGRTAWAHGLAKGCALGALSLFLARFLLGIFPESLNEQCSL